MEPEPTAFAAQLGPPPGLGSLQLTALGEPAALALLLTLYVQAYDTQPGVSIPFKQLDYQNLVRWLDTISELDPATAYPLLLASQVCVMRVPSPIKQMIPWCHPGHDKCTSSCSKISKRLKRRRSCSEVYSTAAQSLIPMRFAS